ncbi:MAG TPA: hypothetical protein VH815_07960 [Acidobacteriota bacterium]|jgi:hypothetical protein
MKLAMESLSKNEIVTEIYTALSGALPPSELALEQIFNALAHTLVAGIRDQQTAGFDNVFNKVEHHLIWNPPEIRQWLIVSFLETLKNVSTWSDIDYEVFEQWLGPETHVAWRWLEKRWQGNRSLADAVRKDKS